MANKLIIDIDGNTKELVKKLTDIDAAAKDAFGKTQKYGKKAMVGIAAGAAAAVGAVTGLATAAVKSYAEYEQLVGGVETLFKKSSGNIMAYAKNAYKTAGQSANQYMETITSFSASLLQGLGGDTAEAARIGNLAVTDMADNVNKMGSSFESVQDAYKGFAKQNYTMLDNLKLGYGGTKTEMVRLINDSGILEKKISDLDGITFDQMIMAIHQVQTNMGITGTTALEAEKTITGSANAAKAAWANLVTGIADENADLDQLIRSFAESVKTLMTNLLPRFKIALETSAKLAIKQFSKLTGIDLEKWLKPGLDAINKFAKNISAGTVSRAMRSLKNYFRDNEKALANFRTALITVFGTAAANKITDFVTKLKGFSDWIVQHKDTIIGAIKGMAIAFGTLTVIGGITKLLDSLVSPLNLILLAAGLLGAAWSSNFLGIQDTVSGFMKYLDPQITKVKNYVKGLKDVFDQSGIGGVVTKIKDDVVGLIPQSVIDAVTEFKNIVADLIPDSVKNAVGTVKNYLASWAKTFKDEGLKAALTQAQADLTTMLPESVVTAISDAATYFGDMKKTLKEEGLSGLIAKVKSDLKNLVPQSVLTAWESLVQTVSTSMASIVTTVATEAQKIKDILFDSFNNGPSLEELEKQFGRIAKMEGDGLTEPKSTGSAEAGIVGMLHGLKWAVETTTTVITTFIESIDDIVENLAIAAKALGDFASKHPEFVRWFVEAGTKVYLFGQLVLGLKGMFAIVSAATGPLGLKLMALALVIATVVALLEALKTAKFEWGSGTGGAGSVYDPNFDWAGTGSFEQTQVIQGPNVEVKAGEVNTKPVSDSIVTAVDAIDATTGVSGLGSVLKQALDILTVESDLPGVSNGIEAGLGTVETNATQSAAGVVQGVGGELSKLNSDTMKKPVEDLNKSITDEFSDTYRELVGQSIVPDMVSKVNAEFEGWWAGAEPGITSVTDGIIGKFTAMAAKLKEIINGLTGKAGMGIEAAPEVTVDPGLAANAGSGLLADLFKPIPQPVIDSYTLLNDAIAALNLEAGKLNGYFGGGAVAVEGGAGEEGAAGSLLAGMTAIAEYAAGDLTTNLTDFGSFLGETFNPAVTGTRDLLYVEGGGGNTLHNALGAIQGVAQDIRTAFVRLIEVWKVDFGEAVDKVKEKSGELLGVLGEIEDAGRAIERAFQDALTAIQAVIAAQQQGISPSGAYSKLPGSSDVDPFPKKAWGGWTSMHGLTLVGERGPELLNTSRMMNVIRNDEIAKRLVSARDTVRNMSTSRLAMTDARRVDQSSTTNNSTNVNLGNVYGDSHLAEFVESVVNRAIRKGVFLGAH